MELVSSSILNGCQIELKSPLNINVHDCLKLEITKNVYLFTHLSVINFKIQILRKVDKFKFSHRIQVLYNSIRNRSHLGMCFDICDSFSTTMTFYYQHHLLIWQ